jgi:hypothetical protein
VALYCRFNTSNPTSTNTEIYEVGGKGSRPSHCFIDNQKTQLGFISGPSFNQNLFSAVLGDFILTFNSQYVLVR